MSSFLKGTTPEQLQAGGVSWYLHDSTTACLCACPRLTQPYQLASQSLGKNLYLLLLVHEVLVS